MSYRYAWNLIQKAEAHLGSKLLDRRTGGSRGESSHLSGEGRRLLNRFNPLNRDVAAYSHRRFVELCDLEESGGRR